MLLSMTGFGRGEVSDEQLALTIELKSLNSRYFEFVSKFPSFLNSFEDEVGKLIKNECSRGRVSINIQYEFLDSSNHDPDINWNLAEKYKKLISQLSEKVDANHPVSAEVYLNFPDVLKSKSTVDEKKVRVLMIKGVKVALRKLFKMRVAEGRNLRTDIENRINIITDKMNTISTLDKNLKVNRTENYKEKVRQIVDNLNLDESRIIQEVAILSEKRDVTEEMVRMSSHIALFKSYFEQSEPVGRRMGFLLQEMGREVNTIGAKTDSFGVSHIIVDIKDELEKIREQVQNIL
ncbi:MAG: YicC family protein [Candidatus Marinimicrobia bacterium]|nr:YicC family protein [Candidatus Neomarinimicrobiota bacterium]